MDATKKTVIDNEMAKMVSDLRNMLNEWQQYRAIEKELGIDLLVGGAALVNGIYTDQFGYVKGDSLVLEKYRIGIPSKSISLPFNGPAGYGKTWALTEEELTDHDK